MYNIYCSWKSPVTQLSIPWVVFSIKGSEGLLWTAGGTPVCCATDVPGRCCIGAVDWVVCLEGDF